MIEFLRHIDHSLFFAINNGLASDALDAVMPWIRFKYTWFPFYAVLTAWMVWKYKGRAVFYITAIVIAVVLSDLVSSHLLKPLFHRLRPCAAPDIMDCVHLVLNRCSNGYSFTSSHAANHFSLAMIISALLRTRMRWIRPVLFTWAALIAFAQVYVGVHYPADVLGGALLGIFTGWIVSRAFYKFVPVRT